MGWFEWGANRNFSATHPLGLNDVRDVQVASSNKFSTTPSYIQPTLLVHNTSFLLNSWVPSPVTLSLPMIHRWHMAGRPLSERSADSGRRWKDSTTTPPILPTLHSPSSPIDMWRRKSWLIFVQRHFSTVCGTDWHVQLSTTSCKLISRSMRRAAPLSSNTIYQYKYKDNTNTSTIQRSALVLKWSIASCTSLLTFIWLLTNPICFLWPDYCSRSWCRWICDKVQFVHVRTLGVDRL